MLFLLSLVSITGLVSSTVYLVLVLKAARRFHVDKRNSIDEGLPLPAASLLKPLHGLEPNLERNLESFFVQEYPDFEIIFGVRTSEDPALEVVAKLQRRYPQVRTRIVLSGEPEYPNAKVFSLEKMLSCAQHSYLVITD